MVIVLQRKISILGSHRKCILRSSENKNHFQLWICVLKQVWILLCFFNPSIPIDSRTFFLPDGFKVLWTAAFDLVLSKLLMTTVTPVFCDVQSCSSSFFLNFEIKAEQVAQVFHSSFILVFEAPLKNWYEVICYWYPSQSWHPKCSSLICLKTYCSVLGISLLITAKLKRKVKVVFM